MEVYLTEKLYYSLLAMPDDRLILLKYLWYPEAAHGDPVAMAVLDFIEWLVWP